MRILSIVGARPQFIKATLISRRLREQGIEEVLVHTGQHYDFNMSEIFFRELKLAKPDYQLRTGSGSHGEQTARMLVGIEKTLDQEKPSIVLVYGDTNTTLAGALAATKLRIPVAHIEAGLRSYNKRMPEEINRVLTDHCADILFCPTESAIRNLQKEGFANVLNDGKLLDDRFDSSLLTDCLLPIVINVGDVMLDMALEAKKLINKKTNEKERVLKKYLLRPKGYILATIHRADNTDNRVNLHNIMQALKEISRSRLRIFFPVHPRTRKALERFNLLDNLSDLIMVSKSVSYIEMVILESNARLILTDSGGIQKEAYFFQTPCIVPRSETEWTELVKIGWNRLVKTTTENIVDAVLTMLNQDFTKKKRMNFYGDGRANERIVEVLKNYGG